MQKSDKTNSQSTERVKVALRRFFRGKNWNKPFPKELSQPNQQGSKEKNDNSIPPPQNE